MAKRPGTSKSAPREKQPRKKLSLYPLDFETALGAALRAGSSSKLAGRTAHKSKKHKSP